MQVRWKTLAIKATFWLASEVGLGLMGLDHLADYSEFVFDRHWIANARIVPAIYR